MTTGFVPHPMTERSLDAERLRELGRAALERATGRKSTLVLSLPAPLAAVDEVLRLRSDDALVWAPPNGVQVAAIGVARELTASGPGRFRDVRSAAERIWPSLATASLGEPPALRVFGGFAFQTGRAGKSPWASFGEARFIVPRLAYVRDERRAWWSLALAPDELEASSFRARIAELDRARAELGRSLERPGPRPRVVSVEQRSFSEWQILVDAIKREIAAGRFEKIVAARRATLELDPAPDPLRVLAKLREQAPACTRFAFRRGSATFVGATPERLIARHGDSVETEALAGSIRPGNAARARELFQSTKERAEHDFVVRDLLGSLAPLARGIVHADRPVVRELRHVLHLSTPIRATLREPRHVLELVERLHPTPAVGGVPTLDALSWIAEHEADERGWYAGPIGWFDADGDGEFCIALRGGVLDDGRAHLYAGAGIVGASQAASEWNETRLKLASLLSALGLEPEDLAEEPT